MATLNLTMPTEGTSVYIINEDITTLDLDFSSADALFERVGDNLIISFDNGSEILLENFYDIYNAEFIPDFVLDGSTIAGADFFTAFDSNLMPAAAGVGGGTSGFAGSTSGNISLDSTSNSDPNSGQSGPDTVGNSELAAGVFSRAGINSPLTFLNLTNFANAGNGDGDNAPSIPDPIVRFASVNEKSGLDDYLVQANAQFNSNINFIELPSEYQNDVAFNTATEELTLSDELKDYINALTPGQVVHTKVTTPEGTFYFELTGNKSGDDSLLIDKFTSAGGMIENQSGLIGQDTAYEHDKGTLKLGEGDDTVRLNSMTSGTVKTGKGDDSVTVGELNEKGWTVGHLSGDATINTGKGEDSIEIIGMNGGTINTGADSDTITGSHIYGGTVNAGNGNDVFDITTAGGTTVLNGGKGADTFTINSVSTDAIVDGGKGKDVITAKYVSGNGQILGNDGKDTIEVSGRLTSGTVDGGNGNDNITIYEATGSSSAAANVHGGAGNDTITVTNSLSSSAEININGDAGKDTIHVNWFSGKAQNATVNGGDDNDILSANSMENGTINGDAGDDKINVTSMHNAATLNGGDGDDIITVTNMHNGTITGGADNDTINVTTMKDGTINSGAGQDDVYVETMTGGLIKDETGPEVMRTYFEDSDTIVDGRDNSGFVFSGDNIQVGAMSGSAKIDAGTQNDVVRVGSVSGDSWEINLGSGSDYLRIDSDMNGGTIKGQGNNDIDLNGELKDGDVLISGKFEADAMSGGKIDTTEGTYTGKKGEYDDKITILGAMTGGSITTGSGDDVISVGSELGDSNYQAAMENATIDTGAGNDTVHVGNLGNNDIYGGAGYPNDMMLNSSITTGAGEDTVHIESLNAGATVNTGADNDTVYFTQIHNNGTGARIDTGDGDDTIIQNSLTYNQVMGNGVINAGDGDDKIDLKTVNGGIVTGARGNDTIEVDTMAGDGGQVWGESGDDNITIGTIYSQGSQVDGGSGVDNIDIDTMKAGTVLGGDGGDFIDVENMQGGYIDGGKGADTTTIVNMSGGRVSGMGDPSDLDRVFITNMTGGTATSEYVKVETMHDGRIEQWENEAEHNGNPHVEIGTMNGGLITTDEGGNSGTDYVKVDNMNGGTIKTDGNNDKVEIGAMTGGTVLAGTGNDTVTVEDLTGFTGTIKGGAHEAGGDTFVLDSANGDTVEITDAGQVIVNGDDTLDITEFENIGAGAGDDTLIGNNSDNVLIGGEGSDTLTGNDGADTFKFDASHFTVGANDVITDFDSKEGDLLDIQSFYDNGYDVTSETVGADVVYTVSKGGESQTITLLGANPAAPQINEYSTGGPATLYEDDMDQGTGSVFMIKDSNGIQSLSIAGIALDLTSTEPQELNIHDDLIVFAKVVQTADGYMVTYTAQLKNNLTHTDDNDINLNFDLVATDSFGASSTEKLTITVVDDKPEITSNEYQAFGANPIITGELGIEAGADGFANYVINGQNVSAGEAFDLGNGRTITMNADGTYSITGVAANSQLSVSIATVDSDGSKSNTADINIQTGNYIEKHKTDTGSETLFKGSDTSNDSDVSGATQYSDTFNYSITTQKKLGFNDTAIGFNSDNSHDVHLRTYGGDDFVNLQVKAQANAYGMYVGDGDDHKNATNLIDTGEGNDFVNVSATANNGIAMYANNQDTERDGDNTSENIILTGSGDDIINISGSDYAMYAASKEYTLFGDHRFGVGKNVIDSGEGNDFIQIQGTIDTDGKHGSSNTINAGDGDDYISVEIIKNGTIYAGKGNDVVSAQTVSNDTVIEGGEGHDIFILNSTAANRIELNDGTVVINNVTTNITGFEGIGGGSGNDFIIGSDNADVLLGGKGSDMLTGGLGDDVFAFTLEDFEAGVVDTITDYEAGELLDLTAYKSAGYGFSVAIDGNNTVFTLTNTDGDTQSIVLENYISSTSINDLQDQLNDADKFNGSITI